ncbi:hypothetical protein WN48_10334 [Eufriesea mexicana]|uniref:Uncharacterized protein n=1 Tax=Eufriesea mexicana TaxID=516756 RepID=A0A310SDV9_9HYME|nr:hypothetical protein WN48_10334 [Eufriesea mexicana]
MAKFRKRGFPLWLKIRREIHGWKITDDRNFVRKLICRSGSVRMAESGRPDQAQELEARVDKLPEVSSTRAVIKELYSAVRCCTKETDLQFMPC